MLLPNKKQRHKSKIKDGENPVFEEKIYFNKIMPGKSACWLLVWFLNVLVSNWDISRTDPKTDV